MTCVAGGVGPVGLATALYAARAGLDVAVVEPRDGVIDKACGEGLMPGAVAALSDLGVPLVGHPIEGIRYLDGTRTAEATFRHGPGRGVRRTTLHRALREAVLGAGVRTGAARRRRDRGPRRPPARRRRATRYLVAADGLHSPIRRMLGLDAPVGGPSRYGQRCHVAVAPWTSFVEVHWSPSAEAYVTPVGPDRGRRRAHRRTPPARRPARRLPAAGAAPRRAPGGAGARRRAAAAAGASTGRRPVLLAGDASGYVDALTGEGIALGLAHARAAVAAVHAGEPRRYEREWRRLGWRHELLTHGLLAATRHRGLRTRVVPAASVLPGVFSAAVNQLVRPA